MADRYLVATGNWNDTATWSDSSGGSPGASVPGSGDNVFLDAASGAAVLTVNVASACLNFDCTGFTGTLAGTGSLEVWGNVFKLVAGMTHTTALAISFRATSGTTQITCAGKTIGITGLIINGSGGTFQLQDKLTLIAGLTLMAGTFDANGQDVLLIGTTATAGRIQGNLTFYNLEYKPSTGGTSRSVILINNITVTNNLVLDSNSTNALYRLHVKSDIRGTQRTITCNGTVTANYCDFEDIAGAGSASWDLSAATGGSGNCGGNSGITFTTPATVYQVGTGNQNFSADVWKTASGGATATRQPLPQDTAVLDANSTTGTMMQVLQRIGTINASAFTGTLTTSTTCTCYGSITLGSGMTLTASTQAYTLAGRGTHTLTSAGKTWAKGLIVDAPGGSYTLQDALAMGSANTLNLTRGTFNANDFDVTCGAFISNNTSIRTLSMGSGTWTLTATSTAKWTTTLIGNLTLNKGTALIKLTGTLTVASTCTFGALTLYNFENATSGAYPIIIRGGPTFNQFKVAAGSKQQFYRSETVTATTWLLTGTSGSPITLASDTTTAAVLAKAGGGTVTADYATVTYLTGTPADTWYATNSTDGGNNTGWAFISAPPAGTPKIMGIEDAAKVCGVATPAVINGVGA